MSLPCCLTTATYISWTCGQRAWLAAGPCQSTGSQREAQASWQAKLPGWMDWMGTMTRAWSLPPACLITVFTWCCGRSTADAMSHHRWLTLGAGAAGFECNLYGSRLHEPKFSPNGIITQCTIIYLFARGPGLWVGEGSFYWHTSQHANGIHHWLHLYLVMLVRIRVCILGSSFLNIGFK